MVFDMRDHLGQLTSKWRKRNYDLDFAVGIAHGYPTVIGTVTNLAAACARKPSPDRSSSPGASSPRSSTWWRRNRLATSRSRVFSARCRSSTLDP